MQKLVNKMSKKAEKRNFTSPKTAKTKKFLKKSKNLSKKIDNLKILYYNTICELFLFVCAEILHIREGGTQAWLKSD